MGLLFAFLHGSNKLKIWLHSLADNLHNFSRHSGRVKECLSIDFLPIG